MMEPTVIDALRARRSRQEATVARLEERLAEERARLAAYDLVIGDAERKETPRLSRRMRVPLAVDDLRGLEPRDALVRIAQREGGTLKYTAARRALVEAGLIAEGREGIEEMRALVNEHPRFERVIGEKGRYRLVLDEPGEVEEPARATSLYAV